MKPIIVRRWRAFPLFLTPVFFAGVCDPGDIDILPVLEDSFSFEVGLEGWSVVASDLGTPPATWSVEVSTEQSTSGASALKVGINNTGGQARVFMKRPFDLEPETEYQIDVRMQLASQDAGAANAWNVVAGASLLEPLDAAGLAVIGTTDNETSEASLQWSERSGILSIRTGPESGRVWISAGVWATSAFDRTYWIDDLAVVVRLP